MRFFVFVLFKWWYKIIFYFFGSLPPPPTSRGDKELVTAAVTKNGKDLEYASEGVCVNVSVCVCADLCVRVCASDRERECARAGKEK